MARFRSRRPEKEEKPVVSDDFIYDEPSEPSASETPDEALAKLRGKPVEEPSAAPADEAPGTDSDQAADDSGAADEKPAARPKRVTSSGIVLGDDLKPVSAPKRERRSHPVLRGIGLTLVTLVLVFAVAAYVFHRIYPSVPVLDAPENAIASVVTPVQTLFSSVTESVVSWLRSLKLRANLEQEYENLRAENEQLVYKAMLADELQQTLSQYEDLSDEIAANAAMRPIVCTIIGKSDSNYFATFTINKGLSDGVEDYMAVTISGALVGYTENVQEHSATVRTIIDSEASIAALIQSSRDQGTVRGTLGVDGTPLCRMYYLPDDNLPRPGDLVVTSGVGMSFPKGIPIGVVRESTRGMEANKQYIVLEPTVDFQHLEYVIVLRYKPQALGVEGRENGRTSLELVPLESARPSPEVPQIASSLFESQNTANPEEEAEATETPSPTPEPTETPSPEPTPEPTPFETPLEYQQVNLSGEPTPSPSPTVAPTPTPYFTPDPDAMTFEED